MKTVIIVLVLIRLPMHPLKKELQKRYIYSIGTNKPTQTCKEQRTLEQHKTLLQRERVHSNFTNAVNKLGEGGYSVFTPTRDNACSERRAVEKQKTLGNADQLSRAQIELLVDTVLTLYPQEVQMYQSLTKKELSIAYLEGMFM
ncbi:unnamed protein product [Cuscuta campestris]|uniref:Uncharacterized protein n=1 Tax=Cuscuta campestris TaxID=132261 RepID=A0A484LER8_9ASTE|nr:unnamed protein product [Cuscuta campestris]